MTSWRMQLTASALGVIAIVSAMITATPLESEIGIVGRGIDHLGDGEDYRRLSRTERSARVASTTTTLMTTISSTKRNATIVVATSRSPTTTTSTSIGKNRMDEHELAIHDDPGRSEDDETPSNFPSTTTLTTMTRITTTGRATRPTTATTLSPGNGTSAKTLEVENRGVSSTSKTTNDLHRSSRLLVSTLVNEDRASTGRTMGQSIEDKDNTIEDVRAISFQVPPPPSLSSSSSSSSSNSKEEEIDDDGQGIEKEEGKGEEEGLAEQEGQERDANERSRSMNNLSLTRGKSTKAFYEIKPSIKTEMEGNRADQVAQRATTSSLIVVPVRKFVLPSVDSAFGKFGPYFEDGDHETNVTARIGSTILLDCKIGMLGDKKVTWLQHSKDSLRLLTVGRIPYSVDQRISLNFRYPSNWRLQILYATSRDSGLYKCQVATHPPLVKRINVIVTAPTLTITDDSGRIISKERHLKAGSALILKCEARGVLESRNESVVWTRGDETLTEDVSENRTMEITAGKEILVIISTLVVDRASPRHAGNYSCVVPGKAKTTIAVHVLNGELPAAVHDGNGVSRAVLNLWLIHLTVSYVFSR